ncbi:MAG: hypothetical protein K2X34_09605, partial [Hyphomonadaceae bacterium]|nr:hypothetical protein [Hyphomonadaceae bacterium]
PFADIDGTLRKEGAHVAPELSTALARLKLKDMFLAADLALNLRLSQRLEQDVLSFVADDEGVDMACQSKDGVMQMIEQRLFDATVRWTLDQGLSVQPHTLDEEPDEELTEYETILDGLARTKILPRGGGPPNQLHGVSARAERDFLAGKTTFLDVGSFDHSTRIPAPLAEGR